MSGREKKKRKGPTYGVIGLFLLQPFNFLDVTLCYAKVELVPFVPQNSKVYSLKQLEMF